MGFPWTLQGYIFREMGKTFLLTAVGMTGVLGLGGGVMNMMKLGEVTPSQLLRLLSLLLPVAAAMTLPIAALFSATSAYGRLSADNEINACRSSGINLHVLFLPPLLLSILAGSVTFAFSNYLIPRMVHNLNKDFGQDAGTYIQQRLRRPRGITLANRYHIHADRFQLDAEKSTTGVLEGVSFLEVVNGEWVRYGTARAVELGFERGDAKVNVWARMAGVSFYDKRDDQFVELEYKSVPSYELPAEVPLKLRFLTFGELLHYRAHPQLWQDVQRALQGLRKATARRLIYDALVQDWLAGEDHTLVLSEPGRRLDIRSQGAARQPRDGGIELTTVHIEEQGPSGRRTFRVPRAVVELAAADSVAEGGILVRLYTDSPRGDRMQERGADTLGPIALSPELSDRVKALRDEDLLAEAAALPGEGENAPASSEGSAVDPQSDPVLRSQTATREEIGSTLRDIAGVLHQRAAFSASVLVLVILGAVLGILLRGSHVLTAFGISFVPSLFVIILIVMGNELAHNARTHFAGLGVMWAGIAVVALGDLALLFGVLRR